jgi:hypothetical protein
MTKEQIERLKKRYQTEEKNTDVQRDRNEAVRNDIITANQHNEFKRQYAIDNTAIDNTTDDNKRDADAENTAINSMSNTLINSMRNTTVAHDREMNEFLIHLAKNANIERFNPFPDRYRITSKPGDHYTAQEYAKLRVDLDELQYQSSIDPQRLTYLKNYILGIDLGIVRHSSSSIHSSIDEYEFKYPAIDEIKRNLRYKKRWYLFHGSPLGNWHSILRTGIKNMSGTRFMSVGAVLGPGVYLANDIRISLSYGMSRSHVSYAASNNSTAIHNDESKKHGKKYDDITSCIAVVEILVDPEKYCKGGDVYVIPDDTILFPRYLLNIKSRAAVKFDGKEILSYYKKQRECLINEIGALSRINKEKDMLIKAGHWIMQLEHDEQTVKDSATTSPSTTTLTSPANIPTIPTASTTQTSPATTLTSPANIPTIPTASAMQTTNNDIWLVAYNGNVFRIYTNGFPYYPAVIQSAFQFDVTSKHFDDQGFYLYDFDDWLPALCYINLLSDIDSKIRSARISQNNKETEIIKIHQDGDVSTINDNTSSFNPSASNSSASDSFTTDDTNSLSAQTTTDYSNLL